MVTLAIKRSLVKTELLFEKVIKASVIIIYYFISVDQAFFIITNKEHLDFILKEILDTEIHTPPAIIIVKAL